ncbi:MAG: hypothetical protein LBG76_01520 [Treponema sp.]|jgi:hypothetical protein|nr:hypothetical protein [Treponema sp.]
MKKITVTLLVLTFFSASVFALPVPTQDGQVQSSSVERYDTPLAPVTVSLDDGLFADVQAVPLTGEEAALVAGDGWFGAIFGAIGGTINGVINGIGVGSSTGGTTGAVILGTLGGIGGGIAGGIAGFLLPF